MLTAIGIVVFIIGVLLAVPVSLFFVQVLCACLLPPVSIKTATGRRPTIAVMVPAHNEEAGIGATLISIQDQLAAVDRLLVIADNCTDATAETARKAGAEVVERFDMTDRGKIYALEFGIAHLRQSPAEVVVVVDADCLVGEGAIDRIARVCAATSRPVQALYLMAAPEGSGAWAQLAEFAWTVKNRVRPLGYHRFGLPCQIMGSGIAYPWSKISAMQIANGYLVEDFKLGLDLAASGSAPLFCPEALVTSQFPVSAEGQRGQRRRWEHGSLALMFRALPGFLVQALAAGNMGLLAMVADLMVPPLALLGLLVTAESTVAAFLWYLSGDAALLYAAAGLLGLLIFSVGLSWVCFGRDIISFRSLATAPFYALSKIPLYLKFFMDRQVAWERTKRDN